MPVDGTYDVEVDSPIGKMKAKLTLATSGSELSGVMDSQMGTYDFSGGTADGQSCAFETAIGSPMGKIKLGVTAQVSGDMISGEVKAGSFGVFPLSGKRL